MAGIGYLFGLARETCENSRQRHPRSSEVKNFVPSKKRFGRLNTERNIAPLGACATWMLPPGRHTKSPAPTLPSESSSDPSSMKVCSSAVCSCNGTTAPGAILNRMVERPSSSLYRIFISIPSKSVRCQGIDDAATKVDRSSGGFTGNGLFMAASPEWLRYHRELETNPAVRPAAIDGDLLVRCGDDVAVDL